MSDKAKPPVPLTVNDVIVFIGNDGLKYGKTSYIKAERHPTYATFEVRVDAKPTLEVVVSHYVMADPPICREYIERNMQRFFKP